MDLSTGLLVETKTDLVLPGRLPVTLTRTAQTNGAVNGPFGRWTTHSTQVVLLVEANRRSLQFGDGRRVTLTQQPNGFYRNLTDGGMQGAVLTFLGGVPTVQWNDKLDIGVGYIVIHCGQPRFWTHSAVSICDPPPS